MIEVLGTLFFAVALVHTFCVSFFAKLSKKYPTNSAAEAFFHLLSEVEIVFGFWAFIFLLTWLLIAGTEPVITYQQSVNLTEPLFIFCIMIVSSTRPIISFSRLIILWISEKLSHIFKLKKNQLQFATLMIIGPILGSFITEPAAITITALLLYRMIDKDKISEKFLYAIIGLLFVNISVGGALTHFAAPPILIVARTWGWNWNDVFRNLGEAAIGTVILNTILISMIFKKQIISTLNSIEKDNYPMPWWVVITHLVFLVCIVMTAHYSQVFFGIFLIFIGLVSVTKNFQDQLKFREAFLVSFFLAGLIIFGSFQRWWLEPLVTSLGEKTLYLGAIGLTAVTDNAALTYLGSQVGGLTEVAKWALVGGALVGGGLTILANAPNPAGFSILSTKFPNSALNAFKLLKAAVIPTLVALVLFYIKLFIIG